MEFVKFVKFVEFVEFVEFVNSLLAGLRIVVCMERLANRAGRPAVPSRFLK